MTKIVTHNSGFHTDDVFAVSTLLLIEPEATVIRSRNRADIDMADYVVDVGMVYEPSKKRFDHHQKEGAGVRENGIPYASFGLVWKEYGPKLAGGERQAFYIDRMLVQPIDAHDNGVSIADYRFKGVEEYVIGDFFNSFIESREPDYLNSVFMKVVTIAKDLLGREILIANKVAESADKVLAVYHESKDKQIIVLPEELIGWGEVLGETKDSIYAVYPRPDGYWSVGCVRDLSKPYGENNRKSLPASWAGKKDQELQIATGVPDALFIHAKRFMGSAKTKEGAIALAKKALEA